MGNYRFRVSDMIPNAWFYKLKDMSTKKTNKTHPTTTTKKASEKKPSCPSPPPPRHTYYYFTPEHPSSGDRSFSRKAIVTQFTEPPRKSAKKKRRPPKLSSASSSTSSSKLVSASVSAGCSCRATFDSVWKPDALPELPPASPPSPPSPPAVAAEEHLDNVHSWSSSCSCRVTSSSTSTDILADGGSVERKTGKLDDGSDSVPSSNSKKSFWSEFNGRLDSVLMDEYDNGFNSVAEVELPPIMTKPAKFNDLTLGLKRREEEPTSRFSRSAKIEEKVLNSYQNSHVSRGSLSHVKVVRDQEKSTSPARRSTSSRGLRIRVNSPRLASKKIQAYTRRSLPEAAARRKSVSESFAVVKSSFDPRRDFRDSMVEMIVENNLRASKDLEDLLACYLSLNSNEYHDVIIKVFEQIWFDLTDIRL